MKTNRRVFLLMLSNFLIAITTAFTRKYYELYENIPLFNKKNEEPVTIKSVQYQWILNKDELR